MNVWLVWTGDYEAALVMGVYASREAAVAGTIAAHQAPYKVNWTDDGKTLTGDFYEFVMGYQSKHVARYDFDEREVRA